MRRLVAFSCVALILTLIASCGDSPITYRYDHGVTERQKTICDSAFSLWNEETLPGRKVEYDLEGDWLVSFPAFIQHDEQTWGGLACRGDTYRCPDKEHIYIALNEATDDTKLTEVCAHEMGHALKLKHVADKNSVMSSPANSTSITDFDRSECQRVGSCASVIGYPAPKQ